MNRYFFLVFTVVLSLLFFGIGSAMAGAKLKIDEDSSIDLGFRLQTQYMQTEADLDNDGNFESVSDFLVRRARIRLKGDVTKHMSMFLQTEFSEGAGTGGDMRIIDAIMTLKSNDWLQLLTGVHMAPVMRQNLTSSGALLAIDRPGLVYKNLTWGTRAKSAFTNTGYNDSDPGIRGSVDVRDLGATLFGSGSIGDGLNAKYYVGIYDGVQRANSDAERISGRFQVNFGDPEPGYFNASTYLGKKKTIGLGVSYDTQASVDVDVNTGNRIDYTLYTADVFVDHPLNGGVLTLEGAYVKLDLDDGTIEKDPGPPAVNFDTRQTAGDGFYLQAGYLVNKWQPWIEYEVWNSDDATDIGSYDIIRLGVSYFMKGHNANVKLGYEVFNADQNIDGSNEDSIGTLVLGFYVTY